EVSKLIDNAGSAQGNCSGSYRVVVMNFGCQCGRVAPQGVEWAPGWSWCSACTLKARRPKYRALAEGLPPSPPRRVNASTDCVHRGGPTGTTVQCGSCKGRVMLRVFA